MSAAYSWQKPYESAILETNFQELPKRIRRAEQAIQQRFPEGFVALADPSEFDAMGKALARLAQLRAESSNANHTQLKLDDEEVGGYSA